MNITGIKSVVILAIFIFGATVLLVSGPKALAAFDLFPSCDYNNSSSACAKTGTNSKKDNVVLRDIKEAADVVAFLAGALAVIMIIVGGFSYVTSGGNSEKTQNAQRRIINSLVGLAIVALAWAITRFIVSHI